MRRIVGDLELIWGVVFVAAAMLVGGWARGPLTLVAGKNGCRTVIGAWRRKDMKWGINYGKQSKRREEWRSVALLPADV